MGLLGSLPETSWDLLGASWGFLGTFGSLLGASWGQFRNSLGRLVGRLGVLVSRKARTPKSLKSLRKIDVSGLFGHFGKHSGAFLGCLRWLLGCLGAILGPSWGHLGGMLSHLGPPGDDLGLSWRPRGPSGSHPGPPWAHHGRPRNPGPLIQNRGWGPFGAPRGRNNKSPPILGGVPLYFVLDEEYVCSARRLLRQLWVHGFFSACFPLLLPLILLFPHYCYFCSFCLCC